MSGRRLLPSLLVLLITIGCRNADLRTSLGGRSVPLFSGMGAHHRPVSTSSKQAQRYFDQGLNWTFAFNHDEAIRSYKEAARLDPNCAMAWWGVALCNGPHINYPMMPPERCREAWDALQEAIALKEGANPTEKALIDALTKRYADPAPADRKHLDEAYAKAICTVWEQNRTDADIGTLCAEAMMDLRPWDLWNLNGSPQPGTSEIVNTLNEVQRLNPDHPGALHLYIHALEASPSPKNALAAANRLRKLVPASGHLVHMPSHIDVLVGDYVQASRQNEQAVKIDRKYRSISPKQDFYRFYMAHNHHMLCFASMMEGRKNAALRAAREMMAGVPEEYGRTNAALVDAIAGAPVDALKRFGRWEEILKEPAPPSYWPITSAMWRFNCGLALAALGRVQEAEREQIEFFSARAKVPKDAMTILNKAQDILAIADHVLTAEIAFRKGQSDLAIDQLRKAIVIEDQLRYMEPPEWIQPVRHTLGAFLVDAGRYDEAEKVYQEDLGNWPDNGWSLYGLKQSLQGQGKTAEAKTVEERYRKAWARADIKLGSSCLCVAGR